MSWEFWIDRGGTFTDVIGRAPDGSLHVAKLLSSATSPADGVRALLERSGAIAPGAPLPPCGLRLGTTVATNALLERRGVATLLVANRGLGDVLEIGTQERPELFALCIHTPLLRRHVAALARALPGSRLRFMQSSGGLADAARFRGPSALLSGPAGGVVGAARVAESAGFARAVGFDMGGTSTDVSLLEAGSLPRDFETQLGGVRLKAPMLRVYSVAAGGGSLCRFDGFRLTVGPESAGAEPGPLCYGRPEARELALTDANFWLGRVQSDRFPFPLERAPVATALDALRTAL